jgi:hypothetical protein
MNSYNIISRVDSTVMKRLFYLGDFNETSLQRLFEGRFAYAQFNLINATQTLLTHKINLMKLIHEKKEIDDDLSIVLISIRNREMRRLIKIGVKKKIQ